MRLYDVFIGTEILQLCNKVLLVAPVRYTEVNFNTKVPLVPKIGVRYKEVSTIKYVRYREVLLYLYLVTFDRRNLDKVIHIQKDHFTQVTSI